MCEHPVKARSCHCAVCHQDFGGVEGFDAHQAFGPFRCKEPPYPRLQMASDGVWRQKGPER
jgi:hypothetical protein